MTNQEAKEILEWELNNFKYTDNEFVEATKVAIKALEEARPTGKWIIDGHHIRCNRCNEYICNTDNECNKIPDNYCPNCGARMER